MQLAAPAASASSPRSRWLTPFVVSLFFAWGFATVLVDTLIPKLKAVFALNYAEVMLTQFAFFLAYLVMSIPAGLILSRIGYLRAVVTGLLVMAVGCLMFSPAARLGVYPAFLAALFVMASGITLLQVAANPLVALLGSTATSHSRLTLAQAFNSLGTAIGPHVGAALILAGGIVAAPDPATTTPAALAAFRVHEAAATQAPFLMIAAGLVVLAAVFWFARRDTTVPIPEKAAGLASTLGLLRRPRVALGALSIFIYVGAEVSIGSLMANYLMQHSTLALPAARAGAVVGYYWTGAMIGRFIGAYVLRVLRPGDVLTLCALAAFALATTSAFSTGMVAAVTIVAIGLFNSVMFPTIFTLGIEGQASDTPEASGLMCMAIVGGAVIPLVTGALADAVGLHLALLAPAACYLWIALYGRLARQPAITIAPLTAPP